MKKHKIVINEKKEKHYTIRGLIKSINLQETIYKAGETIDPKDAEKIIVKINLFLIGLSLIYILINSVIYGANILELMLFIIVYIILAFLLFFILLNVLFLIYLDFRVFKRTNEVETVFPDFLQLASANISAGMPIDKALWYAVRPNFGVLAREIETVAKNTLAGQDLSDALRHFAGKYDSKLIQRSISLILEGLAAGGELADLLNKIALDIEETRIMKRDMAANVMTYVIFIGFATIVAAPVLLGLSTQLLVVIQTITSSMGASMSGGLMGFSMSNSVKVGNFKIFAYVMLTISSISAACIINMIQTGRVKDGLMKIPVFILVSIGLYTLSSVMMASLFAGLI